MRIDLHCHTKKTKKGDGAARNVTPALFKKKIELADVKIVETISEAFIVEFEQYHGLKDIQIVVSQLKTGLFQGVCNYAFWGPVQASPYRSIHGQYTIELAIWDAFSGIRNYDKAEYPNECVIFVKHQGTESIYVNGKGQIVALS